MLALRAQLFGGLRKMKIITIQVQVPDGFDQMTEDRKRHAVMYGNWQQVSGEPVAWMHNQEGRVDCIHKSVKEIWIKVGQPIGFYREKVPCKVEHYTVPLFAAPQQRESLSREVIENLIDQPGDSLSLCRAIENAHNIGVKS